MNTTNQKEIIFGSILLLSNNFQTQGDKLLPEITLKQWFTLIVLKNMKAEGNTVTEIAKKMGYTRQNVKKLLVQLQNKGFIVIKPSLEDARSLCVSITEKSFQYFNENLEKPYAYLASVFEDLTEEEINSLMKLLNKLLLNLQKRGNN